ncbi:MAG TPA: restriction endonuclease subunit S [Candidatus Elarobacter sp.]
MEVTMGFPFGEHGDSAVDVPHIRPFNVTTDGRVSLKQIKTIPRLAAAGRPHLAVGDLLFNNTNSLELVGKCALWRISGRFVFSNHMTRIRVQPGTIDPAFLAFALLHHWSSGRSRTLARAHVAQASIIGERLREVAVPDFSDAEERAIGSILAYVHRDMNLADREIELGECLKRAAMRELFVRGLRGEPQKQTAIGLVPESWKRVRIGDLGAIVTGTTPPTKDTANYENGKLPFVSPGDFEHGTTITKTAKQLTPRGLAAARSLPRGSTCFVSIGATVGKVGLVALDVCATNQQINAIIPSAGIDPRFVFDLMTFWAGYIRSQASPGPLPILSKGVFESIELYVPKGVTEQSEISETLDAIDQKIDVHKRKKDLLDELFRALLNGLMTGAVSASNLDLNALHEA